MRFTVPEICISCFEFKHNQYLIFLYHLFLIYIAIPFNKNVISKRIMMPAAAFTINSACGRDVQLKICIGNVVNWSLGLSGIKGTYTNAPITRSGAVSPIALETAKIIPVNIPPNAEGTTTLLVVCHFVAPIP